MLLFSLIAGHENWGWLSEEPVPWKILDSNGGSSLISMVTDMVISESDISQKIQDLDTSNGPVFIHMGAKIGSNVRIEGPAFVEDGAEIRHGAYLRPGTYVCNGCVVGHSSEVKNTIMMPGSKAPHFNYIGDSILGNDVNLGAGSKISNVRLDRQSVPIQLPDGSRIDSGLRKVGAMIGERSEIGCNVVTNPGAVIAPQSAVPPNMVVTGYWAN
jgi:NDP-sugar pyrophosphorylase family protein